MDETEAYVVDSPERERSTSEIGELIMAAERDRYGGVYPVRQRYRDFKDVREFKAELEELLSKRKEDGQQKR